MIKSQSIIKDLAFDVIVKAAIGKSIAAFPFLGLPIIRNIYAFIVEKIASQLFETLETHIEFKDIEVTEKLKVRAHSAALYKVHNAKTEEEKKAAENEYRKTFANLIRFSN